MLDRAARALVAPPLDAAARLLDRAGVRPILLTSLGWLAGIGACVAAGFQLWIAALLLWLLNRLLDGLDGSVARRSGSTELGGFLDIVADFSIYSGFVVAVAIALPDSRLAAVVLLFAYYLSGSAFLAISSLIERQAAGRLGVDVEPADVATADQVNSAGAGAGRQTRSAERSLQFVGGLAEGTETIVAYLLICLFPGAATTLLWIFAAMVLITFGQRVVIGIRLLRVS